MHVAIDDENDGYVHIDEESIPQPIFTGNGVAEEGKYVLYPEKVEYKYVNRKPTGYY